MKMFRIAALVAALFTAVCNPVAAQWQTPNHSVPLGRGAGVMGHGSAAPGAAGGPIISNGPSSDPSFLSTMILGPSATNPYGAAYPSWLGGIGGLGYYDTKPLANNSGYLPNGPIAVNNVQPYGALNTPSAGIFTVNSLRPGCISGYTNPNQQLAYNETGVNAFCSQADSSPVMLAAAGTFTATTFTPNTPITLSASVYIGVGMFIRTPDNVPFMGQITSWTTNGSAQVTQITVSNWYQIGASTAGTPATFVAYINPLDKLWTELSVTSLNIFTVQGTTTNGSTQITVASTNGIYPNGQFITGAGIPANAMVVGVNAPSTIFISQPATAGGTPILTVTAGTGGNRGVHKEVDLNNYGPNFAETIAKNTMTTAVGSQIITGVVNISVYRPGLFLSGVGIAAGAYITSVDYSTNRIFMSAQATASGTVTVTSFNAFEEAGLGTDCVGVNNDAQACYLARGNQAYSYVSNGARNTAFMVRPSVFSPVPLYGFRYDHILSATNPTFDFSVTSGTTAFWGVDGSGNQITNHIGGSGAQPSVSSCGTGPTFDGTANDVTGNITTGSGATSCTINFAKSYTNAPHCIVMPVAGGSSPNKSETASTLFFNATASTVYTYMCVGR